MENSLNLKGGVLIIGSLLWQDHLHIRKEDNIRKSWRDNNLILDSKLKVIVPIRYGRLSNSSIYTMTFSNDCPEKGTGFFVPFKQSSINTFANLLKEAKEVSIAEGMDGKFLQKNMDGEVWCVLGLLTNPKTVSADKEKLLLNEWKLAIDKDGIFDSLQFKIGQENPCISANGELNLRWPVPVENENTVLDSYDFLIATATKPTNYPDVKELVNKVKADTKRKYFLNNNKSGITTFQDVDVLKQLR